MQNKHFLLMAGITIIIITILLTITFLTAGGEELVSESTSALITPPVSDSSDPETESRDSSSGTGNEQSNPQASQGEETSSPEEVPKMTYEEFIGVEYAIDITSFLKYIDPVDYEQYLILVNYDYPLTADYIPSPLVETPYYRKDRGSQKLQETAAIALDAMMKEAKAYDMSNISVTSGYRSYYTQDWLFKYYIEQYQKNFDTYAECEKYVMTFSTKPGRSEHQTGLVADIHNLPSADQSFANTPEAKWLAENAHRFGFILRYADDKTDITGIMFEPWHFRFVGRRAATYIYQSGICLEEFHQQLENGLSLDNFY